MITHVLELRAGPSSTGSLTILLSASASNEDAAAKVRNVFAGQAMPMLAQVADRAVPHGPD